MLYIILFLLELLILFFLSKKVINIIANFFYRITKNKKTTIYLLAIFFLPGTFIHEISHFLTALFLLVPVGNLELIPQIGEGGVKLGSVEIGKCDFLRRFLIGIAPLVIGTVLIMISIEKLPLIVALYLVFQIGNTMFSSKRDLEGGKVLLLLITIVILILIILEVNLPQTDLVQKSCIHLLLPIGIDSIIFLVS
jgi:hypothetical protein